MTKNGTATVLTESFVYRAPATGTTSGQVEKLTLAASGLNRQYTYTYDKNGNILSVNDGTNTTSYVYDSAGQLLRENNQAANKTWVWTYDNAGNILTRKEYAYTDSTLGTVVDTVDYGYDNSNWGDLLTSYDGQTIDYDKIGNPLDDGTWEYTWEHGRQLASMTDGSTTWTYTYNADGLRTKRTNGSTTYSYVYNGSSLTQMTVGSDTLYFAYDGSSPMSVTYNGTNYYYATNLQGDVVAILNSSGTAVVQYTYDAWGNILTTTGSMASTLGAVNPLTYRGYVFDRETSLYYLQSRYYNPEVGRFINADAFASTGQGLLGNNMFAYCNNNPILLIDSHGTASRACFSNDIDMLDMPWRDAGGGGGYRIERKVSLSGPKKRIDITERLNQAMFSHAEELLSFAKLYGGPVAALYFAKMVKTGGEWDLKSKNAWNLIPSVIYVYDGKELAYDDIGNIHYGFVGRVLFPEKILLLAGGAIQIVSGTSSISFAKYYFDDPRDQVAISFGSSLWEVGLK